MPIGNLRRLSMQPDEKWGPALPIHATIIERGTQTDDKPIIEVNDKVIILVNGEVNDEEDEKVIAEPSSRLSSRRGSRVSGRRLSVSFDKAVAEKEGEKEGQHVELGHVVNSSNL